MHATDATAVFFVLCVALPENSGMPTSGRLVSSLAQLRASDGAGAPVWHAEIRTKRLAGGGIPRRGAFHRGRSHAGDGAEGGLREHVSEAICIPSASREPGHTFSLEAQ